jgi:hypothetical protein
MSLNKGSLSVRQYRLSRTGIVVGHDDGFVLTVVVLLKQSRRQQQNIIDLSVDGFAATTAYVHVCGEKLVNIDNGPSLLPNNVSDVLS